MIKNYVRNYVRNYVKKITIRNKKEMSFLKISDPAKRDLIVKEYFDLKKNIRNNLLSERTGELELQTDLSKFFKPITQTQIATARDITEELKPIKEGIENLPQAIKFPADPSIQGSEEETFVTPYFISDIAESYLRKFTTKAEADRTFGLYDRKGKFYIGNKPVVIKENNIVVENEEYEGTPGLWELIVSKIPEENNYSDEDKKNYARLMVKTNALYRDNNPNNSRPKSSKGLKWTDILSPIWANRKIMKEVGLLLSRVILMHC